MMDKIFSVGNGILFGNKVGIFFAIKAPNTEQGFDAPLGSILLQIPEGSESQIWKKYGLGKKHWKKLQSKTYTSTTNPTQDNDEKDSSRLGITFESGDMWVNIASISVWFCVNGTEKNAMWVQLNSYDSKITSIKDNFVSFSDGTGTQKDSGMNAYSFQKPLTNPITGIGNVNDIAIFNSITGLSGTKAGTAFNVDFENDITNIKSIGKASLGTSKTVARADHVHGVDNTRALDTAVFHISKAAEFITLNEKSKLSLKDVILIEDSDVSNVKRYALIESLPFQKPITNPITGTGTKDQIAIFSDTSKLTCLRQNSAFNVNFEADYKNIQANGDVSAGTGNTVAYGNHVHPTDKTRAKDIDVFHKNRSSEFSSLAIKQKPEGTDTILIESANGTKYYATIGSLPFDGSASNQIKGQGVRGQIAIFTDKNEIASTYLISPDYLPFNQKESNIRMNGITSIGDSHLIADAAHVHPTDTSRASDSNVFHFTGSDEFKALMKKVLPDYDDLIIIEDCEEHTKKYITIGSLLFQRPLDNPITGKGKPGQIPIYSDESTLGGITLNSAFNMPFETDGAQFKADGIASTGARPTIARGDHIHESNFTMIETPIRSLGESYVNTYTSAKIITVTLNTNGNFCDIVIMLNNITLMQKTIPNLPYSNFAYPMTFIVPRGASYKVEAHSEQGTPTILNWVEIY